MNPQAGRDFVLLATIPAADGIDIVGAAQYLRVKVNDAASCEFAITVAEDWRGNGLSTALLTHLIHHAPADGYTTMEGSVLSKNTAMLALARKLGFQVDLVPEDTTVVRVWRGLEASASPPG